MLYAKTQINYLAVLTDISVYLQPNLLTKKQILIVFQQSSFSFITVKE